MPNLKDLDPTGDLVLVKLDKAPEKEGSLHLPDIAVIDNHARLGEIVRRGPGRVDNEGRRMLPTEAFAGDRVVVPNNAIENLDESDPEFDYGLVRGRHILAVLEV